MKHICLVIALLLMVPNITVYVERDCLFTGWFTEPFEIFYVITYTGVRYRATIHHSSMTYFPVQALEQDGFEIKDIAIIIHNHMFAPRFSNVDILTYKRLLAEGFRGGFLLYVQATGRVYKLEMKE